MANQVVSLAYFVSRAKKAKISVETLTAGKVPYQDLLAQLIDVKKAMSLWEDMYESTDALVPLSEIDVSETDYLDIVRQIFSGIDFRDVRIAVDPQPRKKKEDSTHQPYFPQYLATIPKDTRTAPAVTATLERIDEVMTTHGVATTRANGLVVGRVQSGKTRNYIGLMLKAVDEGWNVILVLTSCNTFLAKQTRDRVIREFDKVGANNPKFSRELNFLEKEGSHFHAGAELDGDFFYWGVSMKQADGLNRIRKWMEMPNQPYGSMRVLIVDDEADNATPDSNTGGPGLLDDELIAERIQGIRRTKGYETLADWFEGLLDREWPELGAKTHEADVFGEICDILKGNASKKSILQQIVNGGEFRRILGMDDFNGSAVDELVKSYFDHTGNGETAAGGFVLLLRSVLDIVRGRSAINSAICSLVGPNPETGDYAFPFARCAYLGYTATPYANILNEGPGHTPIYADFIQSLEIPPQYFGAETIFGLDISALYPRLPIVCPITDPENESILRPIREEGFDRIDAALVAHTPDGSAIDWKSLRESVAWAFCSAAARRRARREMSVGERDKLENRWTTMLINIDHKQPVHLLVKEVVEDYVAAQCETVESRENFASRCRTVWETLTAQFTHRQFDDLFNRQEDVSRRYGAIGDYPSWEEIAGDLAFLLENAKHFVHVVVMNCMTAGIEAKALYNQDPAEIAAGEVKELMGDHLWIVSGGNTISRGLTLLGLTASYFDRIRDSSCVDTITQMGRWFGYRPGYELLPRIWMRADAIGEMKRIAVLEKKLHESIADNFAQHFSPADPAHYQQIVSWGRQLSGRAFATRNLDTPIGTIAATPDFYRSADTRHHILLACREFLKSCGAPVDRPPEKYAYASTPLWENVPRRAIRDFLERLLPQYPERSRRLLRGLLREISASEKTDWDVTVGNPSHSGSRGAEDPSPLGVAVNCASPHAVPVDAKALRFSARLHMAFYAMIPTVYLNREDVSLLDAWRKKIFESLDAKRIKNGGTLPSHYDAALPGTAAQPLQSRLDKLIDDLKAADGSTPLPEPIHARLGDISDGFRNRSSGEYMAKVHRTANHKRPTLQLLLARPNGTEAVDDPYVSISFYWPEHDATEFFTVSVDENPDFVVPVTPRGFCQTVEDILRDRDFPMQRKELLRVVLERLGLRCNEAFFSAHIANPLAGYAYHAMKGRNAYCIDGWAADEEQRLGQEFAAAAIDVLRRENRAMRSQDLLDQVVAERPQFRDFYVQHADLDKLLTEEILNANDITVVSHKPITYQYHT